MVSFFYLANQAEIKPSLTTQRQTTAAVFNGAAVDLANYEGPVLAYVNAPVASAADTINFTVEHSEDGLTGWSAIPALALVNPDTGVAATFTQVTDAVAVSQALALKKENLRRYVRLVATVTGTGPDVLFGGWIIGQKRVY